MILRAVKLGGLKRKEAKISMGEAKEKSFFGDNKN